MIPELYFDGIVLKWPYYHAQKLPSRVLKFGDLRVQSHGLPVGRGRPVPGAPERRGVTPAGHLPHRLSLACVLRACSPKVRPVTFSIWSIAVHQWPPGRVRLRGASGLGGTRPGALPPVPCEVRAGQAPSSASV